MAESSTFETRTPPQAPSQDEPLSPSHDQSEAPAEESIQELGKSVILVSQDGEQFTINIKIAKMSELVKDMVDDDYDDTKIQEIPLPNVKAHVLRKVIEFSEHYQSDPLSTIEKPLKSSNIKENVSEWYAEFINLDQEVIFELILAANYMDIEPLLDLSCAKIACMMRGKNPEEIRQTFNIVNDFTPEEEAQVREENKWCEEA